MATPANRVPVRVARGSKANLDTAMAAGDLKEGEICYATDENGIYVVEGGVLTQAGADLASTSIDALSDVDTTTTAPTDGQVLTWVNANGQWEPASTTTSIDDLTDVDTTTVPPTDGQALVWDNTAGQWEPGTISGGGGSSTALDLTDVTGAPTAQYSFTQDTGTSSIASGLINFQDYGAPASFQWYQLYISKTEQGGGQVFWNYVNANLVAGDSNTTADFYLTLPGMSGPQLVTAYLNVVYTNAYVLEIPRNVGQNPDQADWLGSYFPLTDGVSVISFYPAGATPSYGEEGYVMRSNGGANGGFFVTALNADDLGDVDTSTTPPADGQVLTWVDANSKWEPATPASGGVTSIIAGTGISVDQATGDVTVTATGGGGGTTISEAFSTDSGYIHEFAVGTSTSPGLAQAVGSELYINWIDANDRDTRVYVSQLDLDGSTVYWSVDGATWTQYSYTSVAFLGSQARWSLSGGSTTGFPGSGTVYFAFVLAPQDGSLVSPDAIAAKDGTGWANSGTLPRLNGADVNYSQTLRYDTFVADAPTAQGQIGTVAADTSYLRIYETDADGRRVDASKLRSNPTASSAGAPVVFLWVDGVKNRIEVINSTAQVGFQSNYYQYDTLQDISTICSGASEIYVEIPGTPADSASLRWNESLSRWESDPTTARVTRSTVPSTNADAGYPGEMRHDSTHLYVCVEQDTWKRVAWDGTF